MPDIQCWLATKLARERPATKRSATNPAGDDAVTAVTAARRLANPDARRGPRRSQGGAHGEPADQRGGEGAHGGRGGVRGREHERGPQRREDGRRREGREEAGEEGEPGEVERLRVWRRQRQRAQIRRLALSVEATLRLSAADAVAVLFVVGQLLLLPHGHHS
jgi:hypothetical protein